MKSFSNERVPDAPWIGDPDGYFRRPPKEADSWDDSDQRWDEQKYEEDEGDEC